MRTLIAALIALLATTAAPGEGLDERPVEVPADAAPATQGDAAERIAEILEAQRSEQHIPASLSPWCGRTGSSSSSCEDFGTSSARFR